MTPMNRQYAIREWELFKEQLAEEPRQVLDAEGEDAKNHRRTSRLVDRRPLTYENHFAAKD
jgi:hypothetical protein